MNNAILRSIFIFTCINLVVLVGNTLLNAAVTTRTLRYPLNKKVFRVASGDFGENRRKALVVGCDDDHMYFLSEEGKELWRIEVDGLPYGLCVADIDGDRKNEVVILSHDSKGSVLALEYMKGIAWRFSDNQPLLSIAVGDLEGNGENEVVVGGLDGTIYILDAHGKLRVKRRFSRRGAITALACANLDGKPGDEIVAGTWKEGLLLLSNRASLLWRIDQKSGTEFLKKDRMSSHPHHSMTLIHSIKTEDINGDGKKEIIVGSRPWGLVTVVDENGRIAWQKNFPHLMNMWSNVQLQVGNFLGDEKKEIACLLKGIGVNEVKSSTPFVVMDSNGKTVSEVFPHGTFFDFCLLKTPKENYDSLLISSTFNGKGFHRLTMDVRGRNEFERYKDDIDENVRKLLLELRRRPKVEGPEPIKRFHFLVRAKPQIEPIKEFLKRMKSELGNASVEVVFTGIFEKTIKKKPKLAKSKRGLSQEEILNIVRQYERQNIPFYLNIGKHCKLLFQLDTLYEVLRQAKKSCRGFVVDEDGRTGRKWTRFLNDLEQVLSMLSLHSGKKLIMNEYRDFWHRAPFEQDSRVKLFNSRYKDIIVPVYKPSELYAAEINLGIIVGLWKAGAVRNWGVGLYDDMWKWRSDFIGIPSNVLLRFMVMGAGLGANYFVFSASVMEQSKEVGKPAGTHKEYFEVFQKMISTGVISPAEKPQAVEVSPFAIVEKQPRVGRKGRRYSSQVSWEEVYEFKGPLFASYPFQTPRTEYIPGYLYDLRHNYDGIFPRTPHGFICVLPQWIQPSSIEGIKDWWVVSGTAIYDRKGKHIARDAATKAVQRSFRENRDEPRFVSSDVFVSSHRDQDNYIVYVVCPDLLPSSHIRGTIRINCGDKKFQVNDMITGDAIPIKNDEIEVSVPAGLFRILKFSPRTGNPL